MKIEGRNLVVDLEGLRALDGINIRIADGQFVGVVGPNGAGKTTLLRALTGLQELTEGEIRLDGKQISQWSRRELARSIGYLPQGADFYWPITVKRAVSLGRFAYVPQLGRSSAIDSAAITKAMAMAGVSQFAERRVDRISGGERMRVHLARLLAGEHRVIIADEPIASLDAKYQLHFMDVLRKQVAKGVVVIISLHDLSLAARHCDRIVVLDNGHVAEDDTPLSALSDATLAEVFEIRAERLHSEEGVSIVPTHRLPPKNDCDPK